MRRILAATLLLTLLAVAFAAPPVDYELTCGEEGPVIGVLSLTAGKVHVALVADLICDGVDVFVVGPEGAPEIAVAMDWDADPLAVTVTIGTGEDAVAAEDLNIVVVPQVAVDGMLNAQRQRAAAMEMRQAAHAKRDAAREGRAGDGEHGEAGDREPWGPPEVVPPIENPVEPPVDMPYGEVPEGPPAGVPAVERPGGRP